MRKTFVLLHREMFGWNKTYNGGSPNETIICGDALEVKNTDQVVIILPRPSFWDWLTRRELRVIIENRKP